MDLPIFNESQSNLNTNSLLEELTYGKANLIGTTLDLQSHGKYILGDVSRTSSIVIDSTIQHRYLPVSNEGSEFASIWEPGDDSIDSKQFMNLIWINRPSYHISELSNAELGYAINNQLKNLLSVNNIHGNILIPLAEEHQTQNSIVFTLDINQLTDRFSVLKDFLNDSILSASTGITSYDHNKVLLKMPRTNELGEIKTPYPLGYNAIIMERLRHSIMINRASRKIDMSPETRLEVVVPFFCNNLLQITPLINNLEMIGYASANPNQTEEVFNTYRSNIAVPVEGLLANLTRFRSDDRFLLTDLQGGFATNSLGIKVWYLIEALM